jgi:hypothetical protein
MITNREDWLERAVGLLWPLLPERDWARGGVIPPIKVSVGWPKGRHGKKAVGECWDVKASADQSTHHVFISPEITKAEEALAILCHELCHVWAGVEAKHRGPFIRAAKAFGLQKPWTCSRPTEGLATHLGVVAGELGAYPHVGLVPTLKPKQKTRMRLYECSHGQKIRAASDELQATCKDCGTDFVRQGGGDAEGE